MIDHICYDTIVHGDGMLSGAEEKEDQQQYQEQHDDDIDVGDDDYNGQN